MGTLETPQDRHRHTLDGASRAEQTDRGPGGAGSSGGHGGAGSSGGHGGAGSSGSHGGAGSSGGQGRWSLMVVASSLGPATTAGTFVPPKKITMGQLRGTRSPPGLKHTHTVLKKTLVTVWSNTASTGWLVNTAAAGWRYHNRLA